MAQDNSVNQTLLEQDDRIANFLKGKMSKEGESAFMSEIENDPEFRTKAIAMARLAKGLKSVSQQQDNDTIDALLTLDKNTVEKIAKNATKVKAPVISMRTMSMWMSVAACLILVVWFGVGQYNDQQMINLANESYDSFGVSSIARGDNSLSESEQKLLSLFDNVKNGKDLTATIHDLEICWELSTMDIYNDYTNYSAEIGWNLAIGHLKSGNKNSTLLVLQKMESVIDKNSTIEKEIILLKEKLN